MVLGEVGRPIERADIIERDSTALDGFGDLGILENDPVVQLLRPQAPITEQSWRHRVNMLMEDNAPAEPRRDGGWWNSLTRIRPDGLAR